MRVLSEHGQGERDLQAICCSSDLLVPKRVEVSKLSSLWMASIPVTLIGIGTVLVPKPCTSKNGPDTSQCDSLEGMFAVGMEQMLVSKRMGAPWGNPICARSGSPTGRRLSSRKPGSRLWK